MTDILDSREMHDVRDKYRSLDGEYFFTGVQALVRVPFDVLRADRRAGRKTRAFVSGYPGSPLGTFDIELGRQRDIAGSLGLVFNPGLNEELAATSIMGSQLVPTLPNPLVEGVLGIWYGKAPGLDRATDALRHANFAGTSPHGGALAYVGDDPAAKSSSLPSSSEFALRDLLMPTLVPGTTQEVLDLGVHGAALSRASGLWTAFKVVSAIADGSGNVAVSPDRIVPIMPTIEYEGRPWQPSPSGGYMAYQSYQAEQEIMEVRLDAAVQYAAANPGINEITVEPVDAWLGIVSSGRTYYEVVEALRLLGLDPNDLQHYGIRLLRLGMVTPLEPAIVRRFASGLEEIVVVEDSGPFLEVFIKELLYGTVDPPAVLGRRDEQGRPLIAGFGSHLADSLIEPLSARLLQRVPAERLDRRSRLAPALKINVATTELPARQAYFCSGCPHNSSTKVPEGTLVGAGIGCHSMVALMDEDRVGNVLGITQMGGEGTQWIGMAPFIQADHIVQNLGDGTLFHSGSLAIRASVAAGSHLTYKILFNSAVAMTGGQDVAGMLAIPELARELLLEGVTKVVITTDEPHRYRRLSLPSAVEVRPREDLVAVQEELAVVGGVTVLIHDQQCAAEKRRDRKRGRLDDPPLRVVINERVCEGCGDCGDVSNCLSVQPVETEFGRKTRIDQSSCNKDYSCLRGDCPSFLTVEQRRDTRVRGALRSILGRRPTGAATRAAPSPPGLDPDELTKPALLVPDDNMTVRMPGIGGTGVITVSQVLATAAVLDGRYVHGLDQTGFSQKAGAVVSDLRISRQPVEGTNQVSSGQVDLYLIFDLLVALADKNLASVDPGRTIAVVSTSETPTGEMVTHADVTYPDLAEMLADLRAATRADQLVSFDAVQVATALFGAATTANILAVGAAYQQGALPISAEAIEHAIELNGVAVEANKLAFRWGRMLVQSPDRVAAAMDRGHAAEPRLDARIRALIGDLDDGELGRLLRIRVPDLVEYQDLAYAERYIELVRAAAAAEQRVDSTSTELTEAVAWAYYKLLAYKDEYEVARLHLNAAADAVATAAPGPVKVSYNLHPPTLRGLGHDKKIRLGPWVQPAFRALVAGRRLRGTALDPFGYTKVRRIERQLVGEYRQAIESLLPRVTAEMLPAAASLARLPDMVRGYEDIKLRNVERYRSELSRRLAALTSGNGHRSRQR